MKMKSLERSIIFAIVWSCWAVGVTLAKETRSFNESVNHNLFATDLYVAVARNRLTSNVVISPAAVQEALALAYYGAKGQTATEIANGARLEANDVEELMERYGAYHQSYAKGNNLLRLMSAFYINENLEFKGKFKDMAKKSLDTIVEKADFHPPYHRRTAERINKEIEEKTDRKISGLIKAETLDDRTEGIMTVTASFSGPWQTAFRNDRTARRSFSDGGRLSYNVPTMWTLNSFRYGQLSQLDATAVELPYQNTDYNMILLLPHRKDGLANLVQNLAGQNLISLLDANLSRRKVEVYLPIFDVGFAIDFVEPLQALGINTMFTKTGDFGNLYRMFVNYYINRFDHGAHVGVKEDGAHPPLDPTAGLKSVFVDLQQFNADHPFVFAIRHKDSIIFMGHISSFA